MSTSLELSSRATAAHAHAPGGLRELTALAVPTLLQMMSETFCQTLNAAMVGRLGAAELAGVGLANIWLWTALCPFVGIGTGVQVFVSRADGEGRPAECGPWIWRALYVLLPLTVAWAAAMHFAFDPLLAAIDPSPALREHAAAYAQVRLFGFPPVVAGFAVASFFRGVGNTRLPLLASLVSVSVDVVLAYGLVFGELGLPAWGTRGAGVAFLCAEWAYAAVMLGCLGLPAMRRYRPLVLPALDLQDTLRFLRTSAPIGGQFLLDMTSFALFSSIVARMGDAQMAASQALLHLLSLSFQQAYAISLAAGTLVGRYLGAGNPDAAESSFRSAMKLVLLLCGAVAALLLAAPETLMHVFSSDDGVLTLARPLLALGAFFQLIDAIGIIVASCLRGAGDTRWPFAVHAALAWAVRLPLVWLLAITLGGGVFGAWCGELGYLTALVFAFLFRFRAGQWRTMKL